MTANLDHKGKGSWHSTGSMEWRILKIEVQQVCLSAGHGLTPSLTWIKWSDNVTFQEIFRERQSREGKNPVEMDEQEEVNGNADFYIF